MYSEEDGVPFEFYFQDVKDDDDPDKKIKTLQQKSLTSGDIHCSICDQYFTSNEHLKKHLGTKKHKFNQKNLRKEVYKNTSTTREIKNLESISQRQRQGLRERYFTTNRRYYGHHYISYTWSATAFWAARLTINPTVKDFKISHNNKKWGELGDVVIEVEFIDFKGKPSVTKTYVIKFKHIVSTNARNVESLDDGSFNFNKILSKLAGIKGKPDWSNTKFIVFTTASPSPGLNSFSDPIRVKFCDSCSKLPYACDCHERNNTKDVSVFARALSNRRNNILDTSDDMHSIFYLVPSDSKCVLPMMYLYTSQKRPRHLPTAIDEIFFEAVHERQSSVSRDFIKYIENWSEGRCGGTYKLTKEDVLVRIGNIFLSKFTITPEVNSINPNCSFDIWLNAINNVEVTVLKNPVNLSKICEPYNAVIEKEVGLPINVTTDTINFRRSKEQDDVMGIENFILKSMILEEVSKNVHVSIENLYTMFWKAGLIPMILRVSKQKDQDRVLQVIDLLKTFGLSRKYFLITVDDNIKNVVKDFKNVTFFVTLDDIAEKLGFSLMDQVKIQVTDALSLSLGTIHNTDEHFQKTVSANEFFDMALGKYAFKPAGNEEGVEKSKLVLSDEQMRSLRHEVESKAEFRYIAKGESPVRNVHWLRGLNPNIFKNEF